MTTDVTRAKSDDKDQDYKVTVVYANTGESAVLKVPGTMTGAQLRTKAYDELGKTPQPGDLFEIHDEIVNEEQTIAAYAEEFGRHKKELVFEITNPTGGA